MQRGWRVTGWVIAVLVCCAIDVRATPPRNQAITAIQFNIDGVNSLSPSQIEQVKAAVLGKADTSEHLLDTARHLLTGFLENDCYIRPDIDLDVVNANDSPDAAVMHATVQQGVRYRLDRFNVQWAQALSAQQIAQRLPLEAMRRGDCSGLQNVERTVTDFYHAQGFSNVKVHSLVQAHKATQQFDLTLYIDESK